MPYSSTADLPASVRDNLPSAAQRVYMRAYNSADGDESRRAKIAWGAVKNAGWKKREGKWIKTDKRLAASAADVALARLKLTVALAKYNPNQPRANDGKWTTGGGGGAPKLTAPHLGIGGAAARRVMQDEDAKIFTRPLTQSELTGLPAHLDNPHGFVLMYPDKPTLPASNGNPDDMAVFTHDADPGAGLNGIPFEPWEGPQSAEGWMKMPGGDFDEPPLPETKGKRLGAGVIIEEPDGRVWTVAPTNQFGGYKDTLPKGGQEEGLDLRRTAMKEAWEESGLRVELTGYLGDFERTTSVARYYRAKRVGGDPTDYHWETQATKLLPVEALGEALTHPADKPIVAALQGQSGPVVKMLEAGCRLWERTHADEVADEIVAKAWKSSSGKWNKQPRVPSGFPTGGRWTKGGYGGGGVGEMYAKNGAALDLQLIPNDKHPQAIKYNAQIVQMETDANAGVISAATAALASGPTPKNGYLQKAQASAKEAVSYVMAKPANPQPTKPTPPEKHPAKIGVAAAKTQGITTGTVDNPMKLSDLKKVGIKPGGTADGAMYVDASGQKWLVKSYDTDLMAQNEVFAAKLYGALGIATPDMRLIDLEGGHKGGYGVASKWEDNLSKFDPKNPVHVKATQAEFGAHALMANWDVHGLSQFDNTMVRPDGTLVMVDPGGALLYRAQGSPKTADQFGDTVKETTTMRGLDPKISNVTAAAVFGKMDAEALANSYTKAAEAFENAVGSGAVDKILADSFSDGSVQKKLKAKLDARAGNLLDQAFELHANLQSTNSLSAATFGIEKAAVEHVNPAVTALANNYEATALANMFDESIAPIITASYTLTGKSQSFYMDKVDAVEQAAKAGNLEAFGKTEAEGGILYEPTSAAAKASANYGAYLKAVQAGAKAASVKAAMDLQKAPQPEGGTAWAQGTTAKSAATVKAAVKASKQDGESWQSKVADSPNVVQAAPPKSPSPLPAMPEKPAPNKLSNASTPNKGLVAKVEQVDAIVKSGAPDALAQVQAIAATLPAAPKQTYFKNAKAYMANVVAALGGEAALGNMPTTAKIAAAQKGLQKAADADAGKIEVDGPKLSVEAIAKPGHKVIAETSIGGFTVQTIEKAISFRAENLQPPIDFHNFHGPGKKLYNSQPELNAINTAVAAKLYAAASQNDLAKLQAIEVPPSKHLQGYKQGLIDELKAVGSKQTYQKLSGGGDPEGLVSAISTTSKAVNFGAKGIPKQANYIVAGDPGIDQATILKSTVYTKGKILESTQSAFKKFKQATAETVAKTGVSMSNITGFLGSSYLNWNPFLRGYGDPTHGPKAKAAANDFVKASVEIPAYSVLHRGVSSNPSEGLTIEALKAAKGKVLQDHGITSTSFGGKAGFSEKDIIFRMVTTPGTRGLQTQQFTSLKTEREITLPPNYRMLILDVRTPGEVGAEFGEQYSSSNKAVVEVLILPQDDAKI